MTDPRTTTAAYLSTSLDFTQEKLGIVYQQQHYIMASPIQQNLEKKNAEYSAQFSKGDLALPPAKHYTVGMTSPHHVPVPVNAANCRQ